MWSREKFWAWALTPLAEFLADTWVKNNPEVIVNYRDIQRQRARTESAQFVIDNQRAELIECYEEIARLRNEAKAA